MLLSVFGTNVVVSKDMKANPPSGSEERTTALFASVSAVRSMTPMPRTTLAGSIFL